MPVTGLGPYEPNNVFARILRGEIPNRTVFENDYALAFHDIAPAAATHIVIIPKNAFVSFADFSAHATDAELSGFTRAVGETARLLGLEDNGYRILSNMGTHAGQEVGHFHVHLLGNQPLGPIISTSKNPGF